MPISNPVPALAPLARATTRHLLHQAESKGKRETALRGSTKAVTDVKDVEVNGAEVDSEQTEMRNALLAAEAVQYPRWAWGTLACMCTFFIVQSLATAGAISANISANYSLSR